MPGGDGRERFFDYCRARYEVLLRRRVGDPWPWCEDKILRRWRFTNVFREDDKTTAWCRDHIREPLRDDPAVALATFAFRWFNRISTGQLLLDLLGSDWDPAEARRRLAAHDGPVVTGAFVVASQRGMNKADGIVHGIELFRELYGGRGQELLRYDTLEACHSALMEVPYMGPFGAYEVVTDLRHTMYLDTAPDINTWCNMGPGAARGIGRVLHGDPDHYSRFNDPHCCEMLLGARELLAEAHGGAWPGEWPTWELREVEHNLCEFDKYERIRLGEGRGKRRYTPPRQEAENRDHTQS